MNVYADTAATTKLSAAALEEMTEALRDTYGNPSADYAAGREAKVALEAARYEIAMALGCKTSEITFVSGGSEANNQALLTMAAIGLEMGKTHIVTTRMEHPSVQETLAQIKAMGFSTTTLDPDETGRISHERVDHAIKANTCGVCVMLANNELGTIQPIHDIAVHCSIKDVLFFTDAVAAVGRIPVDVDELGVDFLSLSAHKFGGPKGVGALYTREGIDLSRVIQGAGQERGKRAGTENVPGIVGMAAALSDKDEKMEANRAKTEGFRKILIDLLSDIPGTTFNGSYDHALPGTVNFCFDGVPAEELVKALDEQGICVSAGSACHTGTAAPSKTLLAIGRTEEEAKTAIRISVNEDNTEEEIRYLCEQVSACAARLRRP